MKLTMICGVLALLPVFTMAQSLPLTMKPDGGNKRASVAETIGITDVSIHYDRPGVKGRDGKIWGQLVPVGFYDQGFGPSKASPWRAGANENTTISFSTDVTINGQPLPAGKYGFFVAYGPDECTLIFSKNYTSWGSFFYNDNEDALRVKVKPVALDHKVEWLRYEFTDETDNSATVALEWEKLLIPFTVSVDYVQTQLAQMRKELRTERGFTWFAWNQAAAWCAQNHTNLEEASLWADSSVGPNFGGSSSFTAWSTKADILNQLGKTAEAAEVMKKALPLGSMAELHQYGRQLLTEKKPKEALEVFTVNYKKNPGQFTTLMGMARGLSANGNYKEALKYATEAQPLAPDPGNKVHVQDVIDKLKNGQDIN
ncbi:DUF2911 domain-containing protein [Dinghuibacter silviterrae]|uniref:DUF2911 family protein n=1 Tax=Dinghuibacter silviterrae TaxID=1539049 RepID=A0A4R8DU02_9BACT|nr:DUF2911 domain-containing protein [Dinghuibacter silviterrae]TDX00611.1 DUF2911 family protein [Dinghuibacter silviterrae]